MSASRRDINRLADKIDAGHITHAEAEEIADRYHASHFRGRCGMGEEARYTIPADPKRDDDIRLQAYIAQNNDLTDKLPVYAEGDPKDGHPFVPVVDACWCYDPVSGPFEGIAQYCRVPCQYTVTWICAKRGACETTAFYSSAQSARENGRAQ